jgi:hypothetical protein
MRNKHLNTNLKQIKEVIITKRINGTATENNSVTNPSSFLSISTSPHIFNSIS